MTEPKLIAWMPHSMASHSPVPTRRQKAREVQILWRCVWILLAAVLLCPTDAFTQNTRKITGTVSDDSGMPLIGATVQVVGTTVGIATDLNGTYQLDVPTTAAQLIVSYVGYVTQTVDITADVMNIKLRTDAQSVE